MNGPALVPYGAADAARARLLRAFLGAGLVFMLVPGTLLGVMNLLQISGRGSAAFVSTAWIQAHGHAQVFGWVGSFMLGIGFYSVPAHRTGITGLPRAWAAWAMWTSGVALHWVATVDAWHWRVLLPASSVLELAAFLLFLQAVAGHRVAADGAGAPSSRVWMAGVLVGTAGWIVALVLNVAAAATLSIRGNAPVLAHDLDQRLLTLLTWGVFAPFIWGFSARWMPLLLGLRPLKRRLFLAGLAAALLGVALMFAGRTTAATAALAGAAVLATSALRLLEPASGRARTRGVDPGFPRYVRLAYVWLIVAAALGVAAARWDTSGGFWGASRHAFTVGFTAAMIFAVGQRMLPGFAGPTALWSPRLMASGLALLMVGCSLRVAGEVLAYQDYARWAWSVLPASAVVELAAVTLFAVNMFATLWARRTARA